MMDPHGAQGGKLKVIIHFPRKKVIRNYVNIYSFLLQHPMKPAMIPRPGIVQKPAHQHMSYSGSSAASQPGSITHAAWQSTMEGRGPNPQLVIPRAKVKPRSYQQSAHGYNSDEEVSKV